MKNENNATMTKLTLPRHPGRKLNDTKLKSFAKKLFSIPMKYRVYYPDVSEFCKKDKEMVRKKRSGSDVESKAKRRKPGRPKKPKNLVAGVPSMLKFFQKLS